MKTKLLLLALLNIIAIKAYSLDYKIVSAPFGNISASDTWSGTVFIGENARILDNVTISVLPGTVIKMGREVTLTAGSGLKTLHGTIDNPITITSIDDNSIGTTIDHYGATSDGDPNPGDWNEIWLSANNISLTYVNIRYGAKKSLYQSRSALHIASADECLISHCNIYHCESNGANIGKNATLNNCNFSNNGVDGLITSIATIDSLKFTDCTFSHNGRIGVHAMVYSGNILAENCLFENNGDDGFYASGSNSSISRELPAECRINNCTFRANEAYAVNLNTVNIHAPFTGNIVENNGINAFYIESMRSGKKTMLYKNSGIPYIITASVSDTLTLNKGTIVKVTDDDLEILEDGNLIIKGTEGEPIIFTSIYDDSIGGDTNNDNAQTEATIERAIRAASGGKMDITQARFYYCNVQADTEAKTKITHSVFENVNVMPAALSGNANIDHCTFTNNLWGFTPNAYQDTCYVSNCRFLNNTDAGIRTSGEDIDIRNSYFENNKVGVKIWNLYESTHLGLGENATDSIGNNTFSTNIDYDIYNATEHQILAIGNQFDSTTADEIDAKIYDDNEEMGIGEVIFTPWISPQSEVTFIASVNGQLGVGIDISINGSTITTGSNGKASITLPNGDYHYTHSYDGMVSSRIAISVGNDKNVKIVITTTGLAANNEAPQLTLIPNPATSHINITTKTGSYIHQVEFYSLTGKWLHAVNTSHMPSCTLPLQNIPKGIVLVKIHTDNGIGITKLIKR